MKEGHSGVKLRLMVLHLARGWRIDPLMAAIHRYAESDAAAKRHKARDEQADEHGVMYKCRIIPDEIHNEFIHASLPSYWYHSF